MSERSDQATEDPTQRRQLKALEDGQVAFSQDLVGAVMILAAVGFVWMFGTQIAEALLGSIRQRLTDFSAINSTSDTTAETIVFAMRRTAVSMGTPLIAFLFSVAAMVVIVGLLQTGFNLSGKPLAVNWKKLSPLSGFGRIFSIRSVNRLGMSIIKAAGIIAVAIWVIMDRQQEIAAVSASHFPAIIGLGLAILLQITMLSAFFMIVFGLGDFAFQKWKQHKDLMMSKQEIRDEQKDSDGDPQVKARIRKIQSDRSRQRMVQDVPTATVVVTNPTHFAVALRYDPTVSSAPIVVAKGGDHLAKRIIKVAKESDVAVVERKPVARFLYANVEVGQEIPFELYQAVAEILNYIQKLEQSI